MTEQSAEKDRNEPEVWGDGCECWITPRHMHFVHYGATEPGSAVEFNPDCPKHGEPALPAGQG